MKFTSTRNDKIRVSAAQAIVKGLAEDGGLYVPCQFPTVSTDEFLGLDYEKTALLILSKYLPEYEDLAGLIHAAYQAALPVKLSALTENQTVLELFHGKSAAFKDVALQLLPYLLTASLKQVKEERKAVILTATSGDTGSAAMSGFSNVAQTEVIVFYPEVGISPMQRLQMTTQSAPNVHAVAVRGNFDDAQRAVKGILQDHDFAAQFSASSFFSSANSINFGRLLPQIVYYFWAYSQLVSADKNKVGEKVNFSVPTGNFGDILAGYYAKRMGLPVGKLICATNKNSVLYDVLTNGTYDRKREFYVTNSPSMDILVSSNFERLIYHLGGSALAKATQEELATSGKYTLPQAVFEALRETFATEKCDDQETELAIANVAKTENYLLDPHSAIAYEASQKLDLSGHKVILATASPYKFAKTVEQATGEKLSLAGQPKALSGLTERPITQTRIADITQLKATIEDILC
ncbi:MAG: threonine synthase [Lactococcus sp.]